MNNFRPKEMLLKLENIHVHYGGVKALDNINVFLDEGEIVAIMGPNGAGKSTILKTIFGLAPIESGKIFWYGKEIKPVSYKVVKLGMAFVPQGRRVFTNLTIQENLEVGAFILRDRLEIKRKIEEVMDIFPMLKTKRQTKSGTLSGGQQQMLALARGLMLDPKVLLLDEPSLGLAPKIVKEVFLKIKEINKRRKTAVFVVENNIKSLLEIVDRAYILNKGKIFFAGKTAKILQSDVLEKAFLGESDQQRMK